MVPDATDLVEVNGTSVPVAIVCTAPQMFDLVTALDCELNSGNSIAKIKETEEQLGRIQAAYDRCSRHAPFNDSNSTAAFGRAVKKFEV